MDLLELITERMKRDPAKLEKFTLKQVLTRLIIEHLQSMFKWNLPDSMPQEFVELFLIENGMGAAFKLERRPDKLNNLYAGNWVFGSAGYAENPDVYGRGKTVKISTLNGIVETKTPDVDCAVCYNNSLHMSDMMLVEIATNALVELFTSLNSNIAYARIKPVFRVDDDKVKLAVEESFKKIKDNTPIVITSGNVMSKIAEDGSVKDIDVLNITDPENATKLQYLVKCIDDVLRWIFLFIGGQAIQGNGKMAQQSVDEANGDTSISFILPRNRLYYRKKFCETMKRLDPENDYDVDFSESWKSEEKRYNAETDLQMAEADKADAEAGKAAAEQQAIEQAGEQADGAGNESAGEQADERAGEEA